VHDAAKPWILAVDDEPGLLSDIERALGRHYRLSVASDPFAALEIIERRGCPDLVITDQRMPGMRGTELLAKIREQHPESVGIILTGFTGRADLIGAINEGHVFAYLTKPSKAEELLSTVDRALRLSTGRRAAEQLATSLSKLDDELGDLQRFVAGRKGTAGRSFRDVRRKIDDLAVRSGRISLFSLPTQPSSSPSAPEADE
jgi:DNA-binding NtrC family response regulator